MRLLLGNILQFPETLTSYFIYRQDKYTIMAKKNDSDEILEKYKEAFEQLENFDKTGKLEIKKKREDVNQETVLMVENILKKENGLITKKELKHKLRKKIMPKTMNIILKSLKDKGKIIDGKKGILWIYNQSPKLKKAIKEGNFILQTKKEFLKDLEKW